MPTAPGPGGGSSTCEQRGTGPHSHLMNTPFPSSLGQATQTMPFRCGHPEIPLGTLTQPFWRIPGGGGGTPPCSLRSHLHQSPKGAVVDTLCQPLFVTAPNCPLPLYCSAGNAFVAAPGQPFQNSHSFRASSKEGAGA